MADGQDEGERETEGSGGGLWREAPRTGRTEEQPAQVADGGMNNPMLGQMDNTALLLRLLTEQQQVMRVQQEENRRQQERAMRNQEAQQRLLEGMIQNQQEATMRHGEDISRMLKLEEQAAAQKVPKPTLRKLEEQEDIENYLDTFERIAEQQKWPNTVWATQLAGLLTGKALAAYTALTGSDTTDYTKVKTAILHRYEVNEETRRRRFRHEKKKQEESYYAWICRVTDLFDKWIKDSKLGMRETIIIEQVLSQVPTEMGVWLKERKPESLEQLSLLADEYSQVRGNAGNKGQYGRRVDTDGRKPVDGHNRGYQSNHGDRNYGPKQQVGNSHRVQTNTRGEKRCYLCGRWGHLQYSCPNRKGVQENEKKAMFAESCDDVAWNEDSYKYLKRGTLNGQRVQMLVDTGADRTIVAAKAVRGVVLDSKQRVPVLCVHGDVCSYPTAHVELGADGWKQWTQVVVAPNLPVAVLLGRDVQQELVTKGLMVETRSQARRRLQNRQNNSRDDGAEAQTGLQKDQNSMARSDGLSQELTSGDISYPSEETTNEEETDTDTMLGEQEDKQDWLDTWERRERNSSNVDNYTPDKNNQTPAVDNNSHNARTDTTSTSTQRMENILVASPEHIKELQQRDRTLENIRRRLDGELGEDKTTNVHFCYKEGLIMRTWKKKGSPPGLCELEQLVLPVECRPIVLRLAHEVPMAGHLGITKTKNRILQRYYWPGVFKEVAQYCRTCEICQRSRGRKPARAGMIPMPLKTYPFERIAMDIVGPLPKSRKGNRYILTIVDYATRYPEAIALPNTEAEKIAKELINVFSRTGIPEEILTDQGANFMSMLLQEMYLLLHIQRIRTSPYHPQTDGLVERFNGTLKSMLRKFAGRSGKDWDEYLPYLLFAYREVPQESTGVSPFELLYGRKVRGPLDVIREGWTGDEGTSEISTPQILEMRERLEQMREMVKEKATTAQGRQKEYYDRRTLARTFAPGDEVLLLLPNKHNSLKLEWMGPYKITRKMGAVDYEIETSGRRGEQSLSC